jgi:hypothetical protein
VVLVVLVLVLVPVLVLVLLLLVVVVVVLLLLMCPLPTVTTLSLIVMPSTPHTATASCAICCSNLQLLTSTSLKGWPIVTVCPLLISGSSRWSLALTPHSGAHAATNTSAAPGEPSKLPVPTLQFLNVTLCSVQLAKPPASNQKQPSGKACTQWPSIFSYTLSTTRTSEVLMSEPLALFCPKYARVIRTLDRVQ